MDSVPAALSGVTASEVERAEVVERHCPERLLLAERDHLIPLLRSTPENEFDTMTPCSNWSVRDVLAHCAAALTRVVEDRLHDLCPSCNQQDVTDRHNSSIEEIIDELAWGYLHAGPVIAASDGRLDVIALGEWVHAGDVREALGVSPAYAGPGTEDALILLAACSRLRDTPQLTAHLPDRQLTLGHWLPGQQAEASMTADAETVIRMYTGRPVGERPYELVGATPAELRIYR